jgi:hypothetical protein
MRQSWFAQLWRPQACGLIRISRLLGNIMQFAVLATDRAGRVELRERTRAQHRCYLRNPGRHAVRVLLAGPTRSARLIARRDPTQAHRRIVA